MLLQALKGMNPDSPLGLSKTLHSDFVDSKCSDVMLGATYHKVSPLTYDEVFNLHWLDFPDS